MISTTPIFRTAVALLAILPTVGWTQSTLTSKDYVEDFDEFWTQVNENYAYFDQKQTDWARVKQVYRPLFEKVQDRSGFVSLLERALEELYDFHCNLNTNLDSSAVLVPTDADLWANFRNGVATIVDVRKDSPAWKANLRPGAQIISINGVDVATAIAKRIGTCLKKRDSGVDDWALQTLLTGRHNEPIRKLEIKNGHVRTTVNLPLAHRDFSTLLDSRTLGLDKEIGYIRPNNSLGDTDLIAAFDKALDSLKLTRGLVLDLRETPSGGNSLVARAIIGRFVSRECFYQKHQVPAEEQQFGVRRSWVEIVSPRGLFTYKHPVVVLVNHWTGSMGEGIAIGMDAIKRGHVVGVEMARLLGATEGITLPHTRISVHFPTEKLFHPNGLPREKFVPRNYVNLIKTGAQLGEDPILTTGLGILQIHLQASRK
jgi:C-terminal processing protease CtpA/Prc